MLETFFSPLISSHVTESNAVSYVVIPDGKSRRIYKHRSLEGN
jgi:hypothetical protein